MEVYINGLSTISPQIISDASWQAHKSNRLACIEPDYESWLEPRVLRRMSRILKMAGIAAWQALQDAGIEKPDSIVTGTAYGCLEDTGIFLRKMIENKEQALNPTPFIQSTHNTIGSQVAMLLKCHGYNQTITQRAFSFEHTLLDALAVAEDDPDNFILAGSADELTDDSYTLLRRGGMYRPATPAGEGAAYFLLSTNLKPSTYARVRGVHTVYKPASREVLLDRIQKFLNLHNTSIEAMDYVLIGAGGKDRFSEEIFNGHQRIDYTPYCGYYPTISSFGCATAALMLKKQSLPDGLGVAPAKRNSIERILVYHSYFSTHYGMILLERV